MTKIRDLDALVGEDIIVKTGGEEYPVPADIPADLYVRILHHAAKVEQDGDDKDEDEDAGPDPEGELENVEELRNSLLELFQIRQPDLERLPKLGLGQLVQAIGHIYGASDEDEDEGDGDGRPTSAKTTSTAKKRRSKATSASSSS